MCCRASCSGVDEWKGNPRCEEGAMALESCASARFFQRSSGPWQSSSILRVYSCELSLSASTQILYTLSGQCDDANESRTAAPFPSCCGHPHRFPYILLPSLPPIDY